MDMTREFLNGVLELDEPHVIVSGNHKYVDKLMNVIPNEVTVKPLETETLTSIVDYIRNDTDKDVLGESRKYVIHIKGYNEVSLYKELNSDKKRDHLISACFKAPSFSFGRWMDTETFIINVQSSFYDTEGKGNLLQFLSSIKDDTSVTRNDDGVSQTVTAIAGVSLAKKAKVPNPVTLQAFRTFPELEQSDSSFVFRIRKDASENILAALFEADGDAWKHETIQAAKRYLEKELNENDNVIILA